MKSIKNFASAVFIAVIALVTSATTWAKETAIPAAKSVSVNLLRRALFPLHCFYHKHYVMCMSAGDIPSLTDLQQYNVNRPDQVEALKWSLYDTLAYAQAGQAQLRFFQTPQGQNGKTLADTNMTLAGSLPSPQSFLVQSIELYFFPGVDPSVESAANAPAVSAFVNDVFKFYKSSAWLEFYIGSKAYLDEAPLLKFPPSCGLSGWAAHSDAASTGDTSTTISYASAGGPVYELNPPILLVPTQNFNVTINWPAAIALSAAATVTCQMSGILYRNSQ